MDIKTYTKKDMIHEIVEQLHDDILSERIREDSTFLRKLAFDLEIPFSTSELENKDFQLLLILVENVFRYKNKFGDLLIKLSEPNIASNSNKDLSLEYKKFLAELDSLITGKFWPSDLNDHAAAIQLTIIKILSENGQPFKNSLPSPTVLFVLLIKESGKAETYRAIFSHKSKTLPPYPPLDITNIKKCLNDYIEYHFKKIYNNIPYRIDFVLEEEDVYELEADQWDRSEKISLGEWTHVAVKSLNEVVERHMDDNDTMKKMFSSFSLMGERNALILKNDEDLLQICRANLNKYKKKNALFICVEQTAKNQIDLREAIRCAINDFRFPVIIFFRRCASTLKLSEFVDSINLFHSQEEDILKFVRRQRIQYRNTVNPIGKNIILVYNDPDDHDQIINAHTSLKEDSQKYRNWVNSLNSGLQI